MDNHKKITDREFDDILSEILSGMTADELLDLEGIYEIVADYYNDEIINVWEKQHEDEKTSINTEMLEAMEKYIGFIPESYDIDCNSIPCEECPMDIKRKIAIDEDSPDYSCAICLISEIKSKINEAINEKRTQI